MHEKDCQYIIGYYIYLVCKTMEINTKTFLDKEDQKKFSNTQEFVFIIKL